MEIEEKCYFFIQVQVGLKRVASGTDTLEGATLTEFKKRKLIVQSQIIFYSIRRGDEFTTTIEKPETDLTPEMLATGDWKVKKFKSYNFDALGTPLNVGHLHPLLKVCRVTLREGFKSYYD